MVYDFFREGGWGMYATSATGIVAIGAAVVFLLRGDRRFFSLALYGGATAFAFGLLGFCTGAARTLRYLEQVPRPDQLTIAALGCQESLNNVVLALLVVIVTTVLTSAGVFRARPAVPTS